MLKIARRVRGCDCCVPEWGYYDSIGVGHRFVYSWLVVLYIERPSERGVVENSYSASLAGERQGRQGRQGRQQRQRKGESRKR